MKLLASQELNFFFLILSKGIRHDNNGREEMKWENSSNEVVELQEIQKKLQIDKGLISKAKNKG